MSSMFLYRQGPEDEEADAFDVSLTKNAQGLGITIAGYVADKNLGEKDKTQSVPLENSDTTTDCPLHACLCKTTVGTYNDFTFMGW